ncbi:MAG: hypothetical protein QM692_08865 [Thermomicrobiales bacterium]
MHSDRFDDILARLAAEPTRRTALKGLVGSLSAAGLLGVALDDSDAKSKKNKKAKKRKQRREKRETRRDTRRDNDAGAVDTEHNRKKRKKGKNAKGAKAIRCKSYASKCGSKKRCYDLRSDPKHCGSCTVVCGIGEACVNGVCIGS